MRRADWLLLLLAAPPGGALDPVRVQKGMFLLAMEGNLAPEQAYAFEPYAYGPMSRGLYRDVRHLSDARLLASTPIAGASWNLVELTPAGADLVPALREDASRDQPAALAALDAIRRQISALSFNELLAQVYDRYPAYAARTVFRRSP